MRAIDGSEWDELTFREVREVERAVLAAYADEGNWFPNGIFKLKHPDGDWPDNGERARRALRQ